MLTVLYLIIYLNCAEGFQLDHVSLDLECIQNTFKWLCELYNTETTYDFVIINHNWYSSMSNTNDTLQNSNLYEIQWQNFIKCEISMFTISVV